MGVESGAGCLSPSQPVWRYGAKLQENVWNMISVHFYSCQDLSTSWMTECVLGIGVTPKFYIIFADPRDKCGVQIPTLTVTSLLCIHWCVQCTLYNVRMFAAFQQSSIAFCLHFTKLVSILSLLFVTKACRPAKVIVSENGSETIRPVYCDFGTWNILYNVL